MILSINLTCLAKLLGSLHSQLSLVISGCMDAWDDWNVGVEPPGKITMPLLKKSEGAV